MKSKKLGSFIVQLVSIALVSVGFMHPASAGVISSEYVADAQAREAAIERIEVLLATQEVAKQFAALGVDQENVRERIQGLSNAELVALEGQIDKNIAGSDALGVVGAVFLVLLILELVGITDVFKSI